MIKLILYKIILPLVSLAAFIFFIYKFEYVVVLGLISSTLDKTDFFNPLFFFVSLCLGLITGWFLFSFIVGLFRYSQNKKFLVIVFIVSLKIASPYYQFKNRIWLNSVFCPTLTIHGLVSSLRDSAPESFLSIAKSMRERCVLKNFMDNRSGERAQDIVSEYRGFTQNIPNIRKENIPLFAITELNISYPYFDKVGTLEERLDAFTKALEGINLMFKKSVSDQNSSVTFLDKALNFSNTKVMEAFNQSFALYMNREFLKLKAQYLSQMDQSNYKVAFDFMTLRYELLKENLGVSLESK